MRGINSVFRLSVIVAAGLPLAAVASESARRPAAAPVTVDESNFAYPYEKVFDYYIIEAWRSLDNPVPAYTPEMVARHTELVGRLRWVAPTASGNQAMVLGRTPGWPKNPAFPQDPEIPPQNIYGYQITDPSAKGPKIKMVLVSGNHATEFTGNWVLEGMVNFLAGSDPRAVFLATAVFYVSMSIRKEIPGGQRINLKAARTNAGAGAIAAIRSCTPPARGTTTGHGRRAADSRRSTRSPRRSRRIRAAAPTIPGTCTVRRTLETGAPRSSRPA